MFRSHDKNDDGVIDLAEFKHMYSEVMDNTPVRMSDPDFVWLGLFKLFDLDQNREIDAGEAERLLDEQDESLFT